MNKALLHESLSCDICIIGGGLSGCFGALAAARNGAKVVLMQDRPVLGGNASSEIRMWVRGARGYGNKESGLLLELEERNIKRNPYLNHNQFDAELYSMLRENENIRMVMNTSCLDARVENGVIKSVTGWQMTTYKYIDVTAKIFCDCSGDSILAPLVGAEYKHGREGIEEYNETLAQEKEDGRTMGMSVLLAARETDHYVRFTPPAFANVYETDEDFAIDMGEDKAQQIRDHEIGTSKCNLWWVELGGEGHSIYDADRVRDELLCCIYGVWDHIKNRGDHGMDNWELEWVGALPGKRESRRYVGDIVITEQDLLNGGKFEDEIAYGGWPLDDHNPYGMRKNSESNSASRMINLADIYGLSLRALYSKNISNLMFAGRNISVSHVALSSTRVMGTCSLLGEAMGTAAALCINMNISPRECAKDHYKTVQRKLIDGGVFLPHLKKEYSPIIKNAKFNISDEEKATLFNGVERPRSKEDENGIWLKVGGELSFSMEKEERIAKIRLQLDPDYKRKSISDNMKMRIYAMKLHTGKDFNPVRVADTIVKDLDLIVDGEVVYSLRDNFRSLITLPVNKKAKDITIKFISTNGNEKVHIFGIDLQED